MRILICLGVFLLGVTSANAERGVLDWSDLIDEAAQQYEDPYRDLTPEQLGALVDFARLQAALKETTQAEELEKLELRLSEAEAAFSDDGIDAEWLIAQRWIVAERRQNAAWAGEPDLDGQTVTLGGYAIPAPADENGIPTVYLVPERGMCSHMPPPPPNQMVQVRLTGDWRPQMIYEPVRLTGRLSVRPSEREVVVVDGPVRMQATFTMDATEVEPLAFTGAAPAEGNAWVENMTAKLRSAKGQDANEN